MQADLPRTEQRAGAALDRVALDRATPLELADLFHRADLEAAGAVHAARAEVARAIELARAALEGGGRVVLLGAGTSGRLAVLEAAECIPTFSSDRVVGRIAGGEPALLRAREGAEDDREGGARDVADLAVTAADFVLGIAASGRTPYVLGALAAARAAGARTGLLCCSPPPGATGPLDLVLLLETGPELLTGSTRLKAGTATKCALNAITSGAMAGLGKVYDDLMVDVVPSNAKLRDRAVRIVAALAPPEADASGLLAAADGEVKTAVVMARTGLDAAPARARLAAVGGHLRRALEGAEGGRLVTRIDDLAALSRAERRTIVGLMSGTSLDGVDAALCDVSGSGTATQIALRAFRTRPYPPELRARIEDCFRGSVADVCELNVLLGEHYAEVTLALLEEAGVPLDAVDAIASHGQTVHHIDRSQGGIPSTLQLGEAAVIAERTGRLVVSDFRPRDIACGGAGAPLVSYLDHCLFARPGEVTLLQNIGGIANVTAVTEDLADVVAFDTGPGNLLIDEVCRELLGDEDAFDRNGRCSRLGEVDPRLLARLLAHEFLALSPPKTTGRELFGVQFSRALLAEYEREHLIDLLATVVRFTAASIAGAYRAFLLPRFAVREVVVSGGGVHNATLMAALREELAPTGVPVRSFDELELGFSADAKEAVAFAVLANETLQGRPSNVPAATGARRPAVLGRITL